MEPEYLENLLAPLPFPVTFVCRDRKRWSDLFAASESSIPHPDEIYDRIIGNQDCWIVLTYLHLKRRGLNVYLSDFFLPGKICVATSLDFGIKDRTFSSFVVGCRSDGPQPTLCDLAIVQNQVNVESETDFFIPHWCQPGLIPRNQSRGNRIENIVFKGSESNLYEAFRSQEFMGELEQLGVKFKIHSFQENQPLKWHDYSDADLVLAVRDLTEKDALVKPASKLVNAWIAGVPALLGPEPAFQQIMRSQLDYFEVKTPQDALNVIQKLKANPNLYQQIIINGQKRAEEYSVDNVAQKWQNVLATSVPQSYIRWSKSNQLSKISTFILRAFQQKIAVARADYHRTHGYRPVSNRMT
ncbi:MAG: glycosyltransferase family 4 protein [Methylacidiphilales bacterium]|nr:glycosyltransferase family 4 protein [Candidatus Methylacidiphilales bacterium]NJR17808.1 glycosyltransferase family 4 protein [Calothrix sp. CSU_2_0]